MESRKHKEIALKIAKKVGSEYHSDKGVDIRTSTQAIEVEIDPKYFGKAIQQLAGSTRTPYIAVPKKYIKEAVERVKGTRFGIMNENAKIIKKGKKIDFKS